MMKKKNTSPPYPVLVNQPMSNPSYILSRGSQGWLRSNKLQSRAACYKLVGNFISSYLSMSRDPIQPNSMLDRDIQRLLALLDQWRFCSDGLKSFQSRKTWCYLNILWNINTVTQYQIPEELNHRAVDKLFHYRTLLMQWDQDRLCNGNIILFVNTGTEMVARN